MRIAVDARKIRDGGIGSYIRGLLGALGTASGGHEITALLAPGEIGRTRWPGPVREIPVRAGKYGFTEHVVVPRAARRAGADLLHAPHYTLPLGWSGPSVVTIHDLTHIRYGRLFPPGAAAYARAIAGAAARRARCVIVDSSFGRDEVARWLGVPADKVRVIPLGVSPAFAPASGEQIAALRAKRRLPAHYLLY
ncbi:MAG TPA: glycosyltransferase, partial [Terriglobales bacterium]|nr:glycosyltransferase [Terriglobales bacterium]